ncbi:neutral amino acid transporter 9 isoform X2 [Candoia aspera]|uniref:neutral amino acid transporter 9 isoform X2 n=1 Tax=Candoia aspera TaxID=51853 RepID=UPI002FD855ED
MEEDATPLLIPVGGDENDLGVLNIQINPEDLKGKRPFHIEPTNIVSVNDDIQRVTDEASAMNKRIHYYNRLTSPSDRALVAPDHVLPAPEEIYVYSPLGTACKIGSYTDGSGKNSSIITIFMIWNTMMGTSILSIPWGIKQAGFTTGICIILLMGVLTLYCCYRVVKSRSMIPSVDTSTWEFPDVCKYYFGSFGQWSSLLFSLVSLIGAMVVYWVLMSNFLFNTGKCIYNYIHDINVTDIVPGTNGSNRVICPSDTSHEVPGNETSEFSSTSAAGFEEFEKWWVKSKTVPFYLTIILLLLNFKSPSFFAKFNMLGTVSVIYLVILVTVKAALLGFHLEFDSSATNIYFVPEFRIFFPQLTGVLTLAFFLHNCVITLLKNNKNQENNVRDLSIAYFLVGLTYLYVGVLIFAAFPSPPLSKDCIEQFFPCAGFEHRHSRNWSCGGQILSKYRGNHKIFWSNLWPGLCICVPIHHLYHLLASGKSADMVCTTQPSFDNSSRNGKSDGTVFNLKISPKLDFFLCKRCRKYQKVILNSYYKSHAAVDP